MPLGYNDLKRVVQMSGNWDLTYLKKWSLADGTTFDDLVRELGTAIILFNQSLTTGYWGRYVTRTDAITSEYRASSSSSTLPRISEYTRADPIYGDSAGHMIPMYDRGGALGWTYMALRRGRMVRFQNDIAELLDRGRNSWEVDLLTRLFSLAADSVGTGKSLPFVDGGVTDTEYAPPAFNGQAFATSHDHFLRYADDAAGRLAAATAMATHLSEHGLAPPWDLVIPTVDSAAWAAVTGWVKPVRTGIITAGVTERAVVDEAYTGILEVPDGWFQVHPTPRLPTDYAGAFKPMGLDASGNPLLVRNEPGYPLGLSVVAEINQYPLEEAQALMTFGVGVGNRVNGVAAKFASSGTYSTPAIS